MVKAYLCMSTKISGKSDKSGKEVSVMGSGMGMPSIGIYSYELFRFYDVDTIIRVGSSISYVEDIGLYDIVIATSACSESTFALKQGGFKGDIIPADQELVKRLNQSAQKLALKTHSGIIHSSDVFYYQEEEAVSPEGRQSSFHNMIKIALGTL